MKERLLDYLKYLGVGQNSFETRCGLALGSINKINHGIRSDKLALIAKTCPELNLRWLLLGEGEMLVSSDETTKPIKQSGIEVDVIKNTGAVIISDVQALQLMVENAVAKAMGGK